MPILRNSRREPGVAGEAAPVATSSIDVPVQTRSASSSSDASGLTILIAEDEAAIRALAGQVLRSYGCRVLEAADGVEAMELVAQHAGSIHLLLTDLSMPGLDGLELGRRIHNERPEIRILFMSGGAANGLPEEAFLPKPFAAPALVRKVNEVLEIRLVRMPTVRSGPTRTPEFRAGDNVILAEGPYQGTPGVFLRLRQDLNWAEIKERSGRVRPHPGVWLQHSDPPGRPETAEAGERETSAPGDS